jgi:hypothetical protein
MARVFCASSEGRSLAVTIFNKLVYAQHGHELMR